jgi:hypothetical protein
MSSLAEIAEPFIAVAHRIVWANVSTVDSSNRPHSRVLHPLWTWNGETLTGWIATRPTPTKRSHLDHSPFVSVGYWDATHDVATAECRASWHLDDPTCTEVWQRFTDAPEPVGYDPSIVPGWDDPTSPDFAVLRLDPWRLRVMPGTLMLSGEGTLRTWIE